MLFSYEGTKPNFPTVSIQKRWSVLQKEALISRAVGSNYCNSLSSMEAFELICHTKLKLFLPLHLLNPVRMFYPHILLCEAEILKYKIQNLRISRDQGDIKGQILL